MNKAPKPAHLCKYDGRTNTLVEERDLTIGRSDFLNSIRTLWPVFSMETKEPGVLTVQVWSRPGRIIEKPAYTFVITEQ